VRREDDAARWRRWPRFVFWLLGGAIAVVGALAARYVGEAADPAYRVAIWLSGGAVIFLGLAIVSIGTRAHLHERSQAGAGEGNRTLV
jgi:Na+/melibiose symporter-like transporter